MLDAKKEQRKRMFFMSEEGKSRRKKTVTMLKGREFKESFTVYLSPAGVKDKLTSLDVQVSQRKICKAVSSVRIKIFPIILIFLCTLLRSISQKDFF